MPRKREPHFLELNPYYNLKYNELLKEARVWNNSAQYWLSREATRRAACLLNSDISNECCGQHDLQKLMADRLTMSRRNRS